MDTTSGGPIPTTITLDAEPDTVASGTPDTLFALVTPAPLLAEEPEVEFFEGATSLGIAGTDADGLAVRIVPTGFCTEAPCFAPGTHTLTATFPGTPSHGTSSSDPASVLVLSPPID